MRSIVAMLLVPIAAAAAQDASNTSSWHTTTVAALVDHDNSRAKRLQKVERRYRDLGKAAAPQGGRPMAYGAPFAGMSPSGSLLIRAEDSSATALAQTRGSVGQTELLAALRLRLALLDSSLVRASEIEKDSRERTHNASQAAMEARRSVAASRTGESRTSASDWQKGRATALSRQASQLRKQVDLWVDFQSFLRVEREFTQRLIAAAPAS